jgi:hypothetical protein
MGNTVKARRHPSRKRRRFFRKLGSDEKVQDIVRESRRIFR